MGVAKEAAPQMHRQMHGMMAPCAPPPCMSASRKGFAGAEEECDDACDDDDFGGGGARRSFGGGCGLGKGGGARRRTSVTNGPPRVEHLAAAAVICANIQLDASGATAIRLPDDFDGVAFVMLSSDWSCEWQILHPKSVFPASLPSLLQRQLCLTQPYLPQAHMALQASGVLCTMLLHE